MTLTSAPPKAKLVRAIEVWRCDDSGQRLTLASGAYGDDDELRSGSESMSFCLGEGLPGMAWRDRSPVVMHDLQAGEFLRAELAERVGLSSGIAVPCLHRQQVAGVVTFLCDHGQDAEGAFEVWRRNQRDELALSGSYYANLDRFGLISQYVKFPKRAGLPGKVWSEQSPKLVGNLGSSKEFMRAAGARAEGLNAALGLPIFSSPLEIDSVVCLLSSARSPIASVIEVWTPAEPDDEGTDSLTLRSAFYGPYVDLAPAASQRRLSRGEGLAGRAWQEMAPVATDDAPAFETARGRRLSEYGLSTGLGFPVFVGERLAAVVTLIG
ncbi:hypothetical protein Pla175_38560 [Pirellulimonas nuda]|uniref:GAF domain-containing protein n=1 Tax=Pirellulimonas nuda TaxID=2528009 RepID=A0A518DG95_9BACT|nr:GAF domain-containing protein [Pirellulimonas nuda]QDU90452.1 hypothetical protein Pla175_38560 [Pirellulimonas nuda]